MSFATELPPVSPSQSQERSRRDREPFVDTSVAGLFRSLHALYGPYTFGLVSILLVWYIIVAPALATAKVDASAFQHIADTTRDTAQVLSKTVDRMERISDKLDALSTKLGEHRSQ